VGETIGRALADLGYENVGKVRAGRLIGFRLGAADEEGARAAVTEMCEKLIANPVIEDYAIRVRPASAEAGVA
jgi:phosphoribosylformylglycinamidine synthase PurS subunit